MAKHLGLLVLLMASVLCAGAAASPAANTTAYDTLERYNLPRGLLPEGVQGYLLRPDGSFEVYLPGECDLLVGDGATKIRFGSSVGGSIRAGSICELWGVRAQVLFAWVGINRVDRVGRRLRFEVGKFVETFPVGNFAASHRCDGAPPPHF